MRVCYALLKLCVSICQLNCSKASGRGPDGISARMLKSTASAIANPLCHLFNLSLTFGDIPKEWKTASIVPIFKSGLKNQVSNYRPVSCLCIVSRFLRNMYIQ